jgi:hypothetical protein
MATLIAGIKKVTNQHGYGLVIIKGDQVSSNPKLQLK